MQKREFRITTSELRAAKKADNAGNVIEGYAAVFDEPTEISDFFGSFREIVRPGAFTRALKAKQDVRCLYNHDSSVVLGRSKAGTLELSEDDHGLQFRCELPDTQSARDLYTSIERGDIDQCSFGFCCVEDKITTDRNKDGSVDVTRELLDVDLFDVSPVTYPAYEGTSVAARSAEAQEASKDLRIRIDAAIAEVKASQVAEPQNGGECDLMRMRAALALHNG